MRPEERIRVMTVVDSAARLGGAETMALRIAEGLDESRFDSWLCSTRWSASERSRPEAVDLERELQEAGVRFVGLARSSKLAPGAWRSLVSTLRRERIDVLHAHLFGSSFWASLLGPVAGVPVVVAHDHNWSFEGRPGRRIVDRLVIARRASAYVTVSRASRLRMIEVERIPATKVVVVPNGIADARARPREEVRAELDLETEAPVVGTVAVLRPEKALEVLVDAAATLAERVPGVRVLIVGEGPERGRLEDRISTLGLADSVRLLGARRDVADILGALDVAVCCSNWEGMPLSVLEYMRAGLPTVATRVGGLPELVSADTGSLVPARDPPGLADAVAALLADPARRAQLGAEARRRQRSEFSLDAMLGRVGGLYEELLEGAPRRRNA